MKSSQSRKSTIMKSLLIVELIICYMAVLTVVSYLRGPQRYKVVSDTPLLQASDFTSFDGMSVGQGLHVSNQAPGTAAGYLAQLPLTGLDRIHISFEVDCPAEYSGGTLIVDLYDYERAYDSEEQEYHLALQEGLNRASISLEPGEEAPEQAQLRLFTLEAADYEISDLQVYQELPLSKVTPVMLGVVVSCFLVFGMTTIWYFRGAKIRT